MSSGSKTKRWKIEKSQNVNVQFDVFIFSSCGKQAGGGQLTDQDGRRAEHCGEEAVSEGGGGEKPRFLSLLCMLLSATSSS